MDEEVKALALRLAKEERMNVKAIYNECKLGGFPENNMWNRCMRPLCYSKGLALPHDPATAILYLKFSEANENTLGALLRFESSAGYWVF